MRKWGLEHVALPEPPVMNLLDIFALKKTQAIEQIKDSYAQTYKDQFTASANLKDPFRSWLRQVVEHTAQQTATNSRASCSGDASSAQAQRMPIHEYYAAVLAREAPHKKFDEAEAQEIINAVSAHFIQAKRIRQNYEAPVEGCACGLRVEGYDPTDAVNKIKIVMDSVAKDTTKLAIWGQIITETIAKRYTGLKRNTLFYIGDGDGAGSLPLYVDASSELAVNARGCLAAHVPPISKDPRIHGPAVEQVLPNDAEAEESPNKKARTVKPRPTITHEVIYEPFQIETSLGTKVTYRAPYLTRVDMNNDQEETFQKVNKGAPFRARTTLDDHVWVAAPGVNEDKQPASFIGAMAAGSHM